MSNVIERRGDQAMRRYVSAARTQHGVAAVELALIMPMLVMMLAFTLYFGRFYWHYTTAQNAASSAVRYLSTIPHADIINPYRAPMAAAVAYEIVAAQLAQLSPGPILPSVMVSCDMGHCFGGAPPATVSITIKLAVEDMIFPGLTSMSVITVVTASSPYFGR
ncbi:MAG: TadE family protein [Duganella sp.]